MVDLSGVGVALATPFKENLDIDYPSFDRLLEHVIDGGVDYIVLCGTTGESPTLSWNEKIELLNYVVERKTGKPIVFGHGGNNTRALIEQCNDLKTIQFDAILSTSPYYNKPSQKGIIRHYSMLADHFPKPIILYNVPSRTSSNIEANTSLELAQHKNICAIKEASGDLMQVEEIIKKKDADFQVLSGDDQLTHQMIESGAIGVISVIGNIFPSRFSTMVSLTLAKKQKEAEIANDKLINVYELLSNEGNPSSLKCGLNAMGICKDHVRPPLFEGSEQLKEQWKKLLSELT